MSSHSKTLRRASIAGLAALALGFVAARSAYAGDFNVFPGLLGCTTFPIEGQGQATNSDETLASTLADTEATGNAFSAALDYCDSLAPLSCALTSNAGVESDSCNPVVNLSTGQAEWQCTALGYQEVRVCSF